MDNREKEGELFFQAYEVLEKLYDDKGRNLCYYYGEPHRFYHNWEHITSMLKSAKEQNILSEDLMLAILFHDIIYDPKEKDNEEKSAELFKIYYPSKIDVYNAILETKTHKPTTSLSSRLCKLDLEVLYSDFNTFANYENNIFKEYQFVDYKTYVEKRIEVLEKFNVHPFCIDYIKYRKPKIAVYPGSFNPFHKGHYNVLIKAEEIFDKVIIARGINPSKNNEIVDLPIQIQNRQIETYSCLQNQFVDSLGYDVTIVRGLRNSNDFNEEQMQYRVLRDLKPDIKIISFFSDIDTEHISSTAIRTLNKFGENGNRYLL